MLKPEVRKYLQAIGSKGGKVVTERKRLALQRNARQPRKRKKVVDVAEPLC